MPNIVIEHLSSVEDPQALRAFYATWEYRDDLDLVDELAKPDYQCWVARDDHILVGAIFAHLGPFSADVMFVFVSPSHRRLGLAQKLFHEFSTWLGQHGKEEIFLEVRKSNISAQNLYLKLGLEVVATPFQHSGIRSLEFT